MRIAFNATALLSPFTGLAQYTLELAQQLSARPGLELEFFHGYGWGPQVRSGPLPGAGKWAPMLRRWLPRSYELTRWAKNRRFARHARQGGFDLYHEPNFLPLEFDGPVVTTVHDLSWIRFPQAHPPERVRAMNRHFEPALRRSTLILTDSDFVKREVQDVFGVAPERIVSVPLGVNTLFRPQDASGTRSVLAPLDLQHGSYLLSVGTLEPRKNLVTALRAYARLPEAQQRACPFVLAGLQGWNSAALERELAPLIASGRVRLAGYLSRDDLAALIAGAAALVYPSIYEGFGLPPLEAMACGVPTIVSNVSSLPEVVGDTGLLVEPHDVDGIRNAMLGLLQDPALRADLGLRARERAAGFTWQACADRTIEAYRTAVAP